MIDRTEWESIGKMIERVMRKTGGYVSQGKVIDRDANRKVIFLEGFGSQPIPIFGFNYRLKYYDTQSDGSVKVRYLDIEPTLPEIGETVLIIKQQGTRRLPRCVGVLQSTGFVNLDPQEN